MIQILQTIVAMVFISGPFQALAQSQAIPDFKTDEEFVAFVDSQRQEYQKEKDNFDEVSRKLDNAKSKNESSDFYITLSKKIKPVAFWSTVATGIIALATKGNHFAVFTVFISGAALVTGELMDIGGRHYLKVTADQMKEYQTQKEGIEKALIQKQLFVNLLEMKIRH